MNNMGGPQPEKHAEGLFQSTTEDGTTRILTVGYDAYRFYNALLNAADPDVKRVVIHAYPHHVDLSLFETYGDLESFELSSADPDFVFRQTGHSRMSYETAYREEQQRPSRRTHKLQRSPSEASEPPQILGR
jgi:hypothetical protein